MSLIDYSFILFPLKLQNPAWELATLGSLTDHFWALLIGFGFTLTAFFEQDFESVKEIEIRVFNVIRWFFLILGILFILALPLVFGNSNRLATLTKNRIAEQAATRATLIQNLDKNLESINNPQQLQEVAQSLGIEVDPNQSAPVLKSQLREQLANRKTTLTQDVETAQNAEVAKIWRRSIRTVVQIIVISTICILIWYKTREVSVHML